MEVMNEYLYDYLLNVAKLGKWYPIKKKSTLSDIKAMRENFNDLGLVIVVDDYENNLKVIDLMTMQPMAEKVLKVIEEIHNEKLTTKIPNGAFVSDIIASGKCSVKISTETLKEALASLEQKGFIIAGSTVKGNKIYYSNKILKDLN